MLWISNIVDSISLGFTGLDCFEFDCGIFVEFLLDFFCQVRLGFTGCHLVLLGRSLKDEGWCALRSGRKEARGRSGVGVRERDYHDGSDCVSATTVSAIVSAGLTNGLFTLATDTPAPSVNDPKLRWMSSVPPAALVFAGFYRVLLASLWVCFSNWLQWLE